MKDTAYKLVFVLGCIWSLSAVAMKCPLPPAGDDVIGEVRTVVVKVGDTFAKIAYDNDVGYCELTEANPNISPRFPRVGTALIIPSQYVLPNAPREGIVVNLAEMRLYYYPADLKEVWTYPVGIGRLGEITPLGYMLITRHEEKPTWHPPQEFLKLKAKEGITFPKSVPPGPDNPLGDYSMRLSTYPFLIHGTNDNGGVGRRSSAGCVRMFNRDVKELFEKVPDKTIVSVISDPLKVGHHEGQVVLEAHIPLQEFIEKYKDLKPVAQKALEGMSAQENVDVDWERLLAIAKESQGIPQVVTPAKLAMTPVVTAR